MKKVYAKKIENLNFVDKFLGRHKPKLTQEVEN